MLSSIFAKTKSKQLPVLAAKRSRDNFAQYTHHTGTMAFSRSLAPPDISWLQRTAASAASQRRFETRLLFYKLRHKLKSCRPRLQEEVPNCSPAVDDYLLYAA